MIYVKVNQVNAEVIQTLVLTLRQAAKALLVLVVYSKRSVSY